MSEKTKKPNVFKMFVNFLKDVRGELRKVVWPTYKQVVNNTIVVITSVIIVGLLIAGLDVLFSSSLGLVINNSGTGEAANNVQTQQAADGSGAANQIDEATLKQLQEQMNKQNAAGGDQASSNPSGTVAPTGDAVNE